MEKVKVKGGKSWDLYLHQVSIIMLIGMVTVVYNRKRVGVDRDLRMWYIGESFTLTWGYLFKVYLHKFRNQQRGI